MLNSPTRTPRAYLVTYSSRKGLTTHSQEEKKVSLMRQNETRYSCDDLSGCRADMPMTGDGRVHRTMLPRPIRKADELEREERAQDK